MRSRRGACASAVERTAGAAGAFHVNVAVGYGGRQEIVDAVRALLGKELANGATAEQIIDAVTVDGISENLYTSGQPDPDLVIRTSGEQRLSGFPAVAERLLGNVVHRGALAGFPAGGLPARACATTAAGIAASGLSPAITGARYNLRSRSRLIA